MITLSGATMKPVPTMAAEQLSATPSILTTEFIDFSTFSGISTSDGASSEVIRDSTKLRKTSVKGDIERLFCS